MHVDQERRLRELPVAVEVVERIAGEQMRHRLREQIFQRQVDGPDRAMEVDRAEQVGPRLDEVDQRRQAADVDRQARCP